jgi:hypothetical protein
MTPERRLRPLFSLAISAASGIVVRDGVALVIADDRTGLDRYDLADGAALPPLPLLAGHAAASTLPKPVKPDLEAIADLGDGTLVVLGSGSRPNRDQGFRVTGTADLRVAPLELEPLYAHLRREIPALNVEGAALDGRDTLVLAHRGVGPGNASRLVRLDAQPLREPSCARWPASCVRAVQAVDLGLLDGIALAFTDLAPGPGGALYFLAAAEETDDPYRDGSCRGSVIGRLDADGTAHHLARLDPAVKAEGLAYSHRDGAGDHWLVVTDADDPSRRARLFGLSLDAV